MLQTLQDKGTQLSVLYNKYQPTACKIAKKVLPDINFVDVSGQRYDTSVWPDPTVPLRILKKNFKDVSVIEFVFGGETDIDMKTAFAAGFIPVVVSWAVER